MKKTINVMPVVGGIVGVAPKSGETVLVRYAKSGEFEMVEFFTRGAVIDVGLTDEANEMAGEERLLARIFGGSKLVRKFKIKKTGFYRCYAGTGKHGEDEYELIDATHISHWMGLPEFDK